MPGEQKDTALRAVVWTWATNRIGWLDLKDNEPFKSHGDCQEMDGIISGFVTFFFFFSAFCCDILHIEALHLADYNRVPLRLEGVYCRYVKSHVQRLRCSTRVLWASWLPDDQGQRRRGKHGVPRCRHRRIFFFKLPHSGRAWFLCWGWEAYALISAVSRLCKVPKVCCAQKLQLYKSLR